MASSKKRIFSCLGRIFPVILSSFLVFAAGVGAEKYKDGQKVPRNRFSLLKSPLEHVRFSYVIKLKILTVVFVMVV